MIVILIGYGEEKPIYSLCRKIWEMYLGTANLENIMPVFVQTTNNETSETFKFDGRNLTINMLDILGKNFFLSENLHESKTYVASDWTPRDNVYHSEKDRHTFQWIQDYFGGKCSHVYATTVTSILELDALRWIVSKLPNEKLFAGTPGILSNFMGRENFVFISGANTLISRDLFPAISRSSRFDLSGLPNDVLRTMKVDGIKKIYYYRKDIEPSGNDEYIAENYEGLIGAAFEEGYFHFRVKSSGNRTKKDHLILFDIYQQSIQVLGQILKLYLKISQKKCKKGANFIRKI